MLYIIFLAYFAVLIVIALFRNVQKYFTMEAGAYGMAFLLALANAYNTAGILRRPNYFVIGSIGAAFVNAGLVTLISIALTLWIKTPYTGSTIAMIFLMGGFALFGKKKTIKNG